MLLEKYKNDIKRTWSILNNAINKERSVSQYRDTFRSDGQIASNKKGIANKFNEFFVNVGPKLAKQIKVNNNKSVFDFMKKKNPKTMFVNDTNEEEVFNIVKSFSSKFSTGYDQINMYTVKKVINNIIEPLTVICNLSLRNGVFPDNMKVVKVVPLFKAGEKDIFTNYRPVSLLPQFSKVLEKLFNKRLDEFMDKFEILCESQYGFRSNRSTSHAILELMENVTNALDKKQSVIGIFIDLKKTFDTINHNLLLSKLEYYGIRGLSNKWLHSY